MATLIFTAASSLAQPTRPEGPTAGPLQDRILPLDVTVNGEKTGIWPFAERQNELYVGKDALEEWRVQVQPQAQPIMVRGQQYWPLSSVPGFSLKIDFVNQAVDITFAPEAFFATRLTKELELRRPDPVLPSVFLNYDLNFQTTATRGLKVQNTLGSLFELGVSNALGVFTSSHVGTNLFALSGDHSRFTRLETTFTRHLPQQATTIRLGDSTIRPGLWGSSVYFGGLQVSKNYNLQPGFLTQPLPVVGGVSAAPSTVQLYVNDVLRKVSEVPAGPFVIDNLTGVTGGGEARLVVRDILGREVVIVQRYFTSAQLLASGLSDWSFEAGALREDLGIESANYGDRFATGTWRQGLSDQLTVEGRAEVSSKIQASGVGAIFALPWEALGRAAIVASHGEGAGVGLKWNVAFEKQSSTTSLYTQAQGASRRYIELGRSAGNPPPKLEWAASGSTDLRGFGRLGLSVAGVHPYSGNAVRTLSLGYTYLFANRASISATYSRAWGNGSGTLFGISATVPLDSQSSVQASASTHKGVNDVYASYSRYSGGENDFGLRLLAGRIQNEAHAEAGMNYGGRYGRLYSDLSWSRATKSLRTGAAGGIVWADGHAFATRRVDQSFAVVEVKGYADVGVGLGSSTTTRTDANGIALVPYLSPYQQNQVRLNAGDLPISAEVESIEKQVIPVWRSAVKVDFPVRAGRAALLKITFDDGDPAPAGAIVRIEDDKEEFYVARRGEAYVTGLQPANSLMLTWKQGSCRFPVRLPQDAANEDVLRLPPVRCTGVPR